MKTAPIVIDKVLSELLKKIELSESPDYVPRGKPTVEEIRQDLQAMCDSHNLSTGSETGYDCKICLNRGYISIVKPDYGTFYYVQRECECMIIRKNIRKIEKNIAQSGLSELFNLCTFDNFITEQNWQNEYKQLALDFCNSPTHWFFFGGQVGCGKTHLCTAICNNLIKQYKVVKYMLWRDEAVALKSVVNKENEYSERIKALKTVEVLYIDDFLKTKKGDLPTAGDINLAFEILNYRYNNPKLITIISSEKKIDSLLDIDEAVGSRIYQKTKDFYIWVEKDFSKNYRLK